MQPEKEKLVPGLTEGQMVHYVLESGRCNGDHRPAIVVRDWQQPNGLVQLQVFTDGINDDICDGHETARNVLWRTSVHQDEETKAPGTWHWPEKV